jgi:hypothetical protein
MPVISRGEVSYITGAASGMFRVYDEYESHTISGIGRALATMLVSQG